MLLNESGLPTRETNIYKNKKIYTATDLLELRPRGYNDYRDMWDIAKCPALPKVKYAVYGKVLSVDVRRHFTQYIYMKMESPETIDERTGKKLRFYVMIMEGTYDRKRFTSLLNRIVVVTGHVEYSEEYGYGMPAAENAVPIRDFKRSIVPIYTKFKGITKESMRKAIYRLLYMQGEILEPEVIEGRGYAPYHDALQNIHYPETIEDIEIGLRRLVFNDLLYFSLTALPDGEKKEAKGLKMAKTEMMEKFISTLPYCLTGDQRKAVANVVDNAGRGIRNNLLIQGDVGCGKTAVAQCLMFFACENGFQTVLMAPKGKLVTQHYADILPYAEKLGIKTACVTSDLKGRQRKDILEKIASGEVGIIVGTNACISKDVKYKNLGLIISDEEHQFGAKQKDALKEKALKGVHEILMTATPIPRAMTSVIYGDRDTIQIREKPAGREPVTTIAVSDDRGSFDTIRTELKKGHQVYVISPSIDENEEQELEGIENIYKTYAEEFGKDGYLTGIVNGKMNDSDSAKVLDRFRNNECQILISTTVIEVGINVPNATVIVIEHAERFGLSQLHQLRGRVGRGKDKSFCFLVSRDTGTERLKVLCSTNDGFEIAEADMKLRGPGDLTGTRQSGFDNYIEEILTYPDIFKDAREAAATARKEGLGRILLAKYEEHRKCEED